MGEDGEVRGEVQGVSTSSRLKKQWPLDTEIKKAFLRASLVDWLVIDFQKMEVSLFGHVLQ